MNEAMKCKVTFLPDKKEITVNKGESLLSAVIKAGIYLNTSCGGEGVCGRCKIIVKRGKVHTEPTGRITKELKRKGYCLACLSTIIENNTIIQIPPQSRLEQTQISDRLLKTTRLRGIYTKAEDIISLQPPKEDRLYLHSPLATKLYLRLAKPTLQDTVSDLERLYREIRRDNQVPIMQTGLTNIKRLGEILRQANWKITVTLGKRNETTEIVIIEPGDTSNKNYGFAFDIGTTTVSGQLVDLNKAKVLGTKASFNRQVSFGSDIITRIIHASSEDGLEKLHHAVIDNINNIIRELVEDNKINLNDVLGIVYAGNTTMSHLLLRVDPTYIRMEPYVSTANFVPVIRAAEAGIKINPRGLLYAVPGVSTYVGGDITAGVLASRMAEEKSTSLLIDIGTNGEIVLGNSEWLVTCAASAGPAFEGSGVSCGVRAIKGAIEDIKIEDNDQLQIQTIGQTQPIGICGSGYITLLAELFTKGFITKDGKFNTLAKTKRIRRRGSEMEFVVVYKKESSCGSDIVVKESDIDNLKRSKGAIYSAASMLVKKVGLDINEIEQVFIAGGFGTCIDIQKAIIIGLLPDLPIEKFTFIGNSSLNGARQILLSFDAMKRCEEIARSMTYIELSVEPGYMDEYVSSLFFPHTDIGRFPNSIKAGL